MTNRERFKAILDWKTPDRMAWVPRLDIWYNANKSMGTLPACVENMSLTAVEQYLGMGHSARKAAVYKTVYDGEVVEEQIDEGDTILHRYTTPKGTVEGIWHYTRENRKKGIGKTVLKHYITEEKDYGIMQYIVENMRFIPDFESYCKYDAEVGQEGMPMVMTGQCPMHMIMLIYVGYSDFYYHMADYPEKIGALLEAMEHKNKQMWDILAQSPAEFTLHGAHYSADMTPPPIFKKYFLPYLAEFNQKMHDNGKKVAFHADADLTGLLNLVLECGFDVADTFACAPLVRMTFDEARAAWEKKMIIWGGVPSNILESGYPLEKFRKYMEDLYCKTADQPGFIMAVSDNIMPDAEFGRLEWIREIISRGGLK